MKQRLLFLLGVFICWLAVFAIQKPVFMLYHFDPANPTSLTDFLQVIYHGMKLDCSVAGYLTVFPLLLSLVSVWFAHPILQKILKIYFVLAAILIAAIFAIDIALYGYWGFRLDATFLFYLRSPGDAVASIPFGTLLAQIAAFLIYTYGIYWLFRKYIFPLFPNTTIKKPREKYLDATVSLLLTGCILFIFIRGGVTTSTANVGMVYFSTNQYLNHSAINPAFSLLASISKQQNFGDQFDFFPEKERKELFEALTTPNQLAETDLIAENQLLKHQRPNILLILLESFSANVIEPLGGEAGITPHLNRLSQEGILFTNMYANSFRTDRGLVATLNGYLAQPTTSIMKYPAKSQSLPSIAGKLVENGYTADMLYGGDINFTNMQSYFYNSGYSKIVSDKNFPLSSRLSKWGVNDDGTLEYLYQSIEKENKETPWLKTFLTLSSHEPFTVPYHRLEHPYLNSIAFTDSCLGNFMDKFRQLPEWENTLIILISDHGFRYPENLTEYEPSRYHIPMLWLGGAVKEPRVIETIASQTDLAKTLLNQLSIPTYEFTFSKDLADPSYPEYAFYTFNNGFGFIDKSGISIYDNESDQVIYENPSPNPQRINNGKALLQTLYDDLGER